MATPINPSDPLARNSRRERGMVHLLVMETECASGCGAKRLLRDIASAPTCGKRNDY
jgi:hypothetical protein